MYVGPASSAGNFGRVNKLTLYLSDRNDVFLIEVNILSCKQWQVGLI